MQEKVRLADWQKEREYHVMSARLSPDWLKYVSATLIGWRGSEYISGRNILEWTVLPNLGWI
jgi:hypothetical protein